MSQKSHQPHQPPSSSESHTSHQSDSTHLSHSSHSSHLSHSSHKSHKSHLPNHSNLSEYFLSSLDRFPNRPAVITENQTITYSQLHKKALIVSAWLNQSPNPTHCGILGIGSPESFAAILGTLYSYATYVPLNPHFPAQRLLKIIDTLQLSHIVVDEAGMKSLSDLLRISKDHRINFLIPESSQSKASNLQKINHHNNFISPDSIDPLTSIQNRKSSKEDPAYIMFTSGTTGEPKGVPVTNANILHFVKSIHSKYHFNEHDRFSQMFDLSFDLSLFDMFICWSSGAGLHLLKPENRMLPGKYIKKENLTVWFSVPSAANNLLSLRVLKPNAFPALRYSFFCGEPLTATVAKAWQEAAPNSQVINLYGPTELTVACADYRWDTNFSPQECVNGIVPIGKVFDGLEAEIISPDSKPVKPGEKGELLVKGPQTSPGYLNSPQLNNEKFVRLPHDSSTDNRWYRTGDIVSLISPETGMAYHGRIDDQVKVQGYRIELAEIDYHLREVSGSEDAVVVAKYDIEGLVHELIGVLSDSKKTVDDIRNELRLRLPDYMVPSRIIVLERLPLNVNGKVDRKETLKLIDNKLQMK